MEGKVCVICNNGKNTPNFHNKYREYKGCNRTRGIEGNYENKDQLSNQQEIYYEKYRDVLLAKSEVNQQKRKYHTQQIEEPNKKVEDLAWAMETLILKNSKGFKLLNKWHSLTKYIVEYLTDSLPKNNRINIFILKSICMEKSMDDGRPIFHKEN